jgi:misacylated tRNA(Ala) deacylase
MTELLYQTDSYLQEFDSTITAVDVETRSLILDRSAFYPGGGGQPCDIGALTIAGTVYPVEKVKKQGEDVIHFLGGDAPLPSPGAGAHGVIDWARRYELMRTHTAMHVLCGVVFRDYGAQVTGGDMEPLAGRMDFEFATMRAELVHDIEAAVNREVKAGREVRIKILPRDEAFQIPDPMGSPKSAPWNWSVLICKQMVARMCAIRLRWASCGSQITKAKARLTSAFILNLNNHNGFAFTFDVQGNLALAPLPHKQPKPGKNDDFGRFSGN